jgi:hypothetical protein
MDEKKGLFVTTEVTGGEKLLSFFSKKKHKKKDLKILGKRVLKKDLSIKFFCYCL